MGRPGDQGLTAADPVAAVSAALAGVGQGASVVLAVSGGPDSVGMAHLVVAARPDLRATVVHVRHGLRDDAPDAAAAVAHAEALGLAVEVVPVTVGAGAGPEDAARQARLGVLRAAAKSLGATSVLTGHTADDQAETVLLNIARGTGLPGLAGMPPQRPLGDGVTLVHPLLGLRRAAVRAVAAAGGLPLAADPSNNDAQQRRARARADLLPALRALSGGGTDPVVALARLAGHARRDTAALDVVAAGVFGAAAVAWGPVLALTATAVDAEPEAVASRVVRLLLQRAAQDAYPPDTATVDDVLALDDGQERTVAGGVRVSRGGGWLAAVPEGRDVLDNAGGDPPLQLTPVGVVVRAGVQESGAVLPPWAPPGAARCVPVARGAQLVVRARQPGDCIRSAAGTQNVADAMVDAGVPRVARRLVPVISDAEGVLWVPGVAVREGATGAERLWLAPPAAK